MTAPRRLVLCLWLVVPAVALAVILASAIPRARHIEWVSRLGGGEALAVDGDSPTGYAGGARALVAPEHDARSMQWIIQAQEIAARGRLRLDHVDYDNAPEGRPVLTPSPYRGWLCFVGWLLAAPSDLPLPAGIERAVLWADPALHLLLLVGLVLLLARPAGIQAAAWAAAAVAGVFPLAASFLPGRPDELGLALLLAVFSVAPIALVPSLPLGWRRWPWFAAAGTAGGAGLAVSVQVQLPVLIGVLLGVLGTMRLGQGDATAEEAWTSRWGQGGWRVWAITGSGVALAAWLAENAPGRLHWSASGALERNHPAYILAWLGLAVVLDVVRRSRHHRDTARDPRQTPTAHPNHHGRQPSCTRWVWAQLALALGAIAVLPVELLRTGQPGFLAATPVLTRITDLPGEGGTTSLIDWIVNHGLSLATAALLLPFAATLIAVTWSWLHARATHAFAGVVLGLGPFGVALGAAGFRTGYAAVAAALLLALLAPLVIVFRSVRLTRIATWSTGVIAAGAIVIGIVAVLPRYRGGETVSPNEVQALIERDLAWWLARQAPEPAAVVLAPPELTVSLTYFGGLRGLGTPYPENEDGFRAALRLSAATSAAEGQALAESRRVRYIVIPSWDDYLDEYARVGAERPENSLVAQLHRWLAPRWLRPVPYLIPHVEGLPETSVAIFEVVEVQDNPTALARLGEYFVQTGHMSQAAQLAATLKERFAAEPAAWIARAQIAWARRDALAFGEALSGAKRMIEEGAAEALPWDLRVRLALVLASGREHALARDEAQRCLSEMDATLPRTLSNLTLRQFLDLLGSLGLEIADPDLRRTAESLLPAELRQHPTPDER